MTHNTSHDYWISPTALTIEPNAMSDPDKLQASCTAGAQIVVWIDGIIGYDDGHNYRRWPLVAYPTVFTTTTQKYVYVAIPKSIAIGNVATVVYPSEYIDVFGYALRDTQETDDDGNIIQEAVLVGDENHWYIFLGGILTPSVNERGAFVDRELRGMDNGYLNSSLAIQAGPVETDWYRYEQQKGLVIFKKDLDLLRDPESGLPVVGFNIVRIGDALLEWDKDNNALRLKNTHTDQMAHLVATGDLAAFGILDTPEPPHGAEYFRALLDVVSAGTPTANQVWGWNGTAYAWLTMQGGGGASSWNEISDRPQWLDQYKTQKPTVGSWINDMHYLTKDDADKTYLVQSELEGYATQSWVNKQGFLTEHQSLADYAKKEDTVTELGVSGNYLTWKKSNIQQYLTVPYATKSADILSSAWLEDLNEPIWSTGFGITLQEYNKEAQNKPVTIDNANYIINIGGDQHGTNAHYGWQIAFADGGADVYMRHAYASWSGSTTSQAYDPWHRLAFADMPIGQADTLTSWRKIWGQWFNGSGNVDGNFIQGGIQGSSWELTLAQAVSGGGIGHCFISGNSDKPILFLGDYDNNKEYCPVGVNTINPTHPLHVNGSLRIGDAVLEYDAVNKALFVKDANEQAMNLVATGDVAGFSALGSIDSLTDLSLTDWLKVGKWKVSNNAIVYDNEVTMLWWKADEDLIMLGDDGNYNVCIDSNLNVSDSYGITAKKIKVSTVEATTLKLNNNAISDISFGEDSKGNYMSVTIDGVTRTFYEG